jgi:protein O-mannosyl-transferase
LKKELPKKELQKKGIPNQNQIFKTNIRKSSYYDLIGSGIIIVLGFVIYSNSFHCSFHFDDTRTIVDNPLIRDLWNVKAWWNYSPNRHFSIFSFVLNYHFNQLDVRYWHLVNLVIHMVNACLAGWLTLLIFASPRVKDKPIAKDRKILAFIIALLFVSHPLATQSVTYIVQRQTSLAAMLYFLSLGFYIKGRLADKGARARYIWYAGSAIAAILAVTSKEIAFTLPLAIMLTEVFFIRKNKLTINFRDYRVILSAVILLGLAFILPSWYSFSIFRTIPPSGGNAYTLTPFTYLFTQFSVILKYIQLLFLPVHQNLDYDYPVSTGFFEIRTILSFLVLVLLMILAIFLYRKNRVISFGISWFFLTLSIESGIIPITDVIFEHRTYLPSFGFFLVLTTVLYLLLWKKYKYAAIALFAVIIVSNSVLTFERNKVWKDDMTLWTDNLSKSPGKPRTIVNLGYAYGEQGQWSKAVEYYTKAIGISPAYPDAYNNRGFAYGKLDQWDKSIADYSSALQITPKLASALYNRAVAYDKVGQLEKAIADYSAVIAIEPSFATAWYNRGVDYGRLGNQDKAMTDYTMAVSLDPKYAVAYANRGVSYGNAGQWEKAIAEYTSAIAADPGSFIAYYNRADAYENTGQFDKAIEDYTKAISIDPGSAKAYSNRGIAWAYSRQWEKALADCAEAIRLDPKFAKAYYNRGIVYSALGQWNKVLEDCTSAIALDPSYIQAYSNRGAAYGNLGQLEKSIADYSKAIGIDPNYATAYYNRAVAYESIGQKEKAEADYAMAIRLNPKYQEAYNKRRSH